MLVVLVGGYLVWRWWLRRGGVRLVVRGVGPSLRGSRCWLVVVLGLVCFALSGAFRGVVGGLWWRLLQRRGLVVAVVVR